MPSTAIRPPTLSASAFSLPAAVGSSAPISFCASLPSLPSSLISTSNHRRSKRCVRVGAAATLLDDAYASGDRRFRAPRCAPSWREDRHGGENARRLRSEYGGLAQCGGSLPRRREDRALHPHLEPVRLRTRPVARNRCRFSARTPSMAKARSWRRESCARSIWVSSGRSFGPPMSGAHFTRAIPQEFWRGLATRPLIFIRPARQAIRLLRLCG